MRSKRLRSMLTAETFSMAIVLFFLFSVLRSMMIRLPSRVISVLRQRKNCHKSTSSVSARIASRPIRPPPAMNSLRVPSSRLLIKSSTSSI